MRFSTILIFIWLVAPLSISEACPSDTSLITSADGRSSWCLRSYNATPMNFCNAIRTCRQNGEQMVGKSVLDAIRAAQPANIFVTSTRYLWVGLTDALLERDSNKDGWVWLDTGSATTLEDGSAYFEISEPNSLTKQDCVTTYTSNRQLRDAGCDETNYFYCYSGAAAPAAATDPLYSIYLPARISAYNQPDPGCWVGPATLPSLLHCARACFTFGAAAGDCVGVYWHPARLECVLLPYFDAAVPLGFANAEEKRLWQKFLVAK